MPQRPRSTGLPIWRAVVGDAEAAAGDDVRPEGVAPDAHAAVVLPLVGIADLGVEGGELLQRLGLGSRAHPVEPADGVAHGQQAGSSPSPACAPWPRAGSASRRTCCPSASPSSSSVDSTQRFQRGFISLAPPRYALVEREVLLARTASTARARRECEQVPLAGSVFQVASGVSASCRSTLLQELRLAARSGRTRGMPAASK